jgi:hypothetical protein
MERGVYNNGWITSPQEARNDGKGACVSYEVVGITKGVDFRLCENDEKRYGLLPALASLQSQQHNLLRHCELTKSARQSSSAKTLHVLKLCILIFNS